MTMVPLFAGATNRWGQRPTDRTVEQNRLRALQALLAGWPEGVRVPVDARGSLLHVAVIFEKSTAIVDALLTLWPEGAHATNGEGDTPLHRAAACNHHAILRRLLDVDAEGPSRANLHGRYPIHFAALSPGVESLEILLAAWPEGVRSVDGMGNTPLHFAARRNPATLRRLLAAWPEGWKVANSVRETPESISSFFTASVRPCERQTVT